MVIFMLEFAEIFIKREYGKLFLQNVFVNEKTSIAFVYVPDSVELSTCEALRTYLLRIKDDLENIGFPGDITFVLFQGKEAYAYGANIWQRFFSRIEDPAAYMMNMFVSNDEDWVLRMMHASEIAKQLAGCEITVKETVVSEEEAVKMYKERLGIA